MVSKLAEEGKVAIRCQPVLQLACAHAGCAQ